MGNSLDFDIWLSECISGEVHLAGIPNEQQPGDLKLLTACWMDEPLRCYAAARNAHLLIMGDSHSVFVQGNNITICLEGDNIRLGVDGQNVKVEVKGQGTILYTDSCVTFEGPNQIAQRYALNAPDCPEVLPFKLKRDEAQGVTGNSWFLDMVYDRQARSSNDDNPVNGLNEDDEEDADENLPDDDEEDADENLPDDDEEDADENLPDDDEEDAGENLPDDDEEDSSGNRSDDEDSTGSNPDQDGAEKLGEDNATEQENETQQMSNAGENAVANDSMPNPADADSDRTLRKRTMTQADISTIGTSDKKVKKM